MYIWSSSETSSNLLIEEKPNRNTHSSVIYISYKSLKWIAVHNFECPHHECNTHGKACCEPRSLILVQSQSLSFSTLKKMKRESTNENVRFQDSDSIIIGI